MKKKVKTYLRKTNTFLALKGFFDFLPDEIFLKMRYKLILEKALNLEEPKTFNEKLQWLKAYNKKPVFTAMVDKYEVKQYVANLIGEEYIIPTYGVWNCFEDIDFDELPNQFVLKCTHDSNSTIICKDKNSFDFEKCKILVKRGLKRKFYRSGREWPYKNVKPRIIAEKFVSKQDGSIPEDYKFLNFDGEPRIIQVDLDRFTHHKRKLFSPDWTSLDFDFNYPTDHGRTVERPVALDEMLSLAKILSEGMPFLRTDFYHIDGKVYFGELTFFPESGYGKFTPEEWDEKLGSWITLPKKTIINI